MEYNKLNKQYDDFKKQYDNFENKYYDEIQKYKEFDKENFSGIDRFLKAFKRIGITIIVIFAIFSIIVVGVAFLLYFSLPMFHR